MPTKTKILKPNIVDSQPEIQRQGITADDKEKAEYCVQRKI